MSGQFSWWQLESGCPRSEKSRCWCEKCVWIVPVQWTKNRK